MADRDFRMEDGEWFPIMNGLAEKMATTHLSGTEGQVLWMLLRKCYGFQRSSCDLRWKKIKEYTQLQDHSLSKALKKLREKNIISTCKNASKIHTTYKINSKLSTWKTLAKKQDLPKRKQTLAKTEVTPIKETIKETPIIPKKKPQKKTALTDDFLLTDKLKFYAVDNDILPDKVNKLFEAFKDHHIGNGNLKVIWDRAWYNWVRSAPEYSKWAVTPGKVFNPKEKK